MLCLCKLLAHSRVETRHRPPSLKSLHYRITRSVLDYVMNSDSRRHLKVHKFEARVSIVATAVVGVPESHYISENQTRTIRCSTVFLMLSTLFRDEGFE